MERDQICLEAPTKVAARGGFLYQSRRLDSCWIPRRGLSDSFVGRRIRAIPWAVARTEGRKPRLPAGRPAKRGGMTNSRRHMQSAFLWKASIERMIPLRRANSRRRGFMRAPTAARRSSGACARLSWEGTRKWRLHLCPGRRSSSRRRRTAASAMSARRNCPVFRHGEESARPNSTFREGRMTIELKVYDNGDHTCLVWLTSDGKPIPNCRGFAIHRTLKASDGAAAQESYLHGFVGFSD